jgi:hypothetical protein
MNDSTAEYLGNGNGNGQSSGHSPFGLVAKEDPIHYSVAPKARREVMFDTSMPEGARMFYCFLSDCSLWRGVASRPGVVGFTNGDLAERFDVDVKTIQNWKRVLITRGRIWTSEKFKKNCYATTVYNVTAIVGQAMLPLDLDDDQGLLTQTTSNRRRSRRPDRDPVTGKWTRGEGGPKTVETSKTIVLPENADYQAPTGKILPSSTATICRPQRQPIAAHNGKILPSPTATICRGKGKEIAVAHGNHLPLSTATICRGARQAVADKKESLIGVKSLESKGEPLPQESDEEKAFKEWRATLNGRFPSHLEKMRIRFLEQRKRVSKAGLKLLNRKLDELARLLDGPQPEWAEAKPAAQPAAPKVTAEQFASQGAKLSAAIRAAGL